MLSIRVGEGALPWLWEVVETGGAIGFYKQGQLLNTALTYTPTDLSVVAMGVWVMVMMWFNVHLGNGNLILVRVLFVQIIG